MYQLTENIRSSTTMGSTNRLNYLLTYLKCSSLIKLLSWNTKKKNTWNARETCTRDWYQKLARKFDVSSSQFLAQKQLSGQSCCRVRVTCPDSFCAGIELCSIVCKKLVPEKTWTRLTDTGTSFSYKTTCTSFWYKFLERVLPALVYCWRFTNDDTAVFIGTVWLISVRC